jgi:Zn finger protein HypA/HybF involved in hydrogenase expression
VSLNEQFNQQYGEMIDTVKSRAIWRVGEKVVEGETFRGKCPKCGYQSLHQRFDVTRHRLLFGKAIREIETPRLMVRCRRCNQQCHLRDVGELVVPSTITLFDEIRAGAVEHLATRPAEGAVLPAELDEKLAAFREEASGPVRQQLLAAIAKSSPGAATAGAVADLGRALYLAADQIAAAAEPNT